MVVDAVVTPFSSSEEGLGGAPKVSELHLPFVHKNVRGLMIDDDGCGGGGELGVRVMVMKRGVNYRTALAPTCGDTSYTIHPFIDLNKIQHKHARQRMASNGRRRRRR